MLNPGLAPASQGCGMPFEDGEAGAIKLCSLISGVIISSLQTSETLLHPPTAPNCCGSFQEPAIRGITQQPQTAHGGLRGGEFLSPSQIHLSRRAMCASEAAVPRSSAAKR